jgi:hypothetical protein
MSQLWLNPCDRDLGHGRGEASGRKKRRDPKFLQQPLAPATPSYSIDKERKETGFIGHHHTQRSMMMKSVVQMDRRMILFTVPAFTLEAAGSADQA